MSIDIEQLKKSLIKIDELTGKRKKIQPLRNIVLALKQLQAEIEKLKKASKWISVDSPPKNVGTYQVVGGFGYNGTENWPHVKQYLIVGNHGFWNSDSITHWKPLPKLPKDKDTTNIN